LERSIIVIEGPTCSGKTKAGINLASSINGEIISADSRQIYKYLDIGTAKPEKKELNSVKHHFIDELAPDEDYNVSKFEKDALNRIEMIFNAQKTPIVIGGSGLYIKALIEGIVETPGRDKALREELSEKKEKFGNEYIHKELQKVDPESAAVIHPSYWKRVIRALEVYYLTGKKISSFHSEQNINRKYNFKEFILNWPRDILYKNIEKRVDKMIELGLKEETEKILNMGYSKELNSLNTVGYKEIIAYLDNEISFDRAIELIKRNTRRFAKRQLTWYRKNESLNWISINSENEIDDFVENLISKEFN